MDLREQEYRKTDGLIEFRICPNTAFDPGSIHGNTAFRFTRHLLYSVPVLNDFAVFIEAKEIHRHVLLVSARSGECEVPRNRLPQSRAGTQSPCSDILWPSSQSTQ